MGWHAYFALGGTEIINAERTEAYLADRKVSWFHPQYRTDAISRIEGHPYTNTWTDQPVWADPDDPDTYDFYGAYPLNVTGLEDSSRTAVVTENLYDGGWIGNIRHATKSIVMEVALLGASTCAVEAGFKWLKQALLTDSCLDGGCGDGVDLCYFACEPCLPPGCGDTLTPPYYLVTPAVRTVLEDFEEGVVGTAVPVGGYITDATDVTYSSDHHGGSKGAVLTGSFPDHTSPFLDVVVNTPGSEVECWFKYDPMGTNCEHFLQMGFFDADNNGVTATINFQFPSIGDPPLTRCYFEAYNDFTSTSDKQTLDPSLHQSQWLKLTLTSDGLATLYDTDGTTVITTRNCGPVDGDIVYTEVRGGPVVGSPGPDGHMWVDDISYIPTASSEPLPSDCATAYQRTLRNVKVISGPTITAQRDLSDGGAVWTATFTVVAANPFEFGPEQQLVQGFMVESDPWLPEVVPADWMSFTYGMTVTDVDCSVTEYQPIVDPLCPAIEVPPSVPAVQLGCYTPPDAWTRRWFSIPRKYIPYWGDSVPVVSVQAGADAVRNLRLRFYSDLNADGSVLDDPCAYCGDILFSYIPPNTSLVFDGAAETVYATGPGGAIQRADSLVFKTDGTPFDWPLLTCGYGYIVAVDLPDDHTGDLPAIDLSLYTRTA